jgi:hypothetical protein
VPVFVSVYAWLTGVYVLPTVHDEVRPPAGVTVSGPATVAADTVKEAIEMVSHPCPEFVESAVQPGPLAIESYWLPYHATFHEYVPGAVGAGALNVTGHNGAFTGGFPVPVLLATSAPA